MRNFLFLLSIFGVLIGIGCGGSPEAGVRVDSQFRPLIPPDAMVLAGIDLESLKQTPIYKRYQHLLDDDARLNQLTERLGVDARRDVSSIVIAENATGRLVLVRGRFTQQPLEEKLRSMGAKQSSYKGHTLFGDVHNAMTFLKPGLIAAGSAETIHDATDRADGGKGGIPTALQKRLATLRKNDSAWVVSSGGLPLLGAALTQDAQSMLSNLDGFINGVSAGLSADTGLHLQADLQCVSNEGAHRVHDALKGGIGLARLTTNDNALDMLRLYDSIEVNQESEKVYVKADLPADLINKIAAHFPQILDHVNRRLGNRQ